MYSWAELWNQSPFWDVQDPSAHFSTPAIACPTVLAAWVDQLLADHGLDHVVEVGAGDAPVRPATRVRRSAVDVRTVSGVDDSVTARWDAGARCWSTGLEHLWDERRPVLLLAVEWLDDLACPVLRRAEGGWMEVGPEGEVGPADPADARWAERWWPGDETVDVGRPRDDAWAWFARRLPPGSVLVTIDYGHTRDDRPLCSTLSSHLDGRQVTPGPGANLTAHVAFDSLADAALSAGAAPVGGGFLRDLEPPAPSPAGALADLGARSERALWRGRFGGHRWLVQRVGSHNGPRAD